MKKIRLIHWKTVEAGEKLAVLKAAGFQVELEEISPALLKAIRERPPDALVIDLSRLPSQGRDLGIGFRKYRSTRLVPLIFAGGDPEKTTGIKKILPDAFFTEWEDIVKTIKRAVSSPPSDPVVPGSIMDAYSGRPLSQKLGIKPGMELALKDAPANFEKTLGKLPEKVRIVEHINPSADLSIWFNRSRTKLETKIEGIRDRLGDQSAVWIAWPKQSSGEASDLTQNHVRRIGLASGLVDYKICSVDKTWSALLFTRRKLK